jgi:hypothetical protein
MGELPDLSMTSFYSETRNMREDSPEYKAILLKYVERYKREQLSNARKHKAALRIIELCAPVRRLSVSKLYYMKDEDLLRIGLASRELFDAMEKAGLLGKGTVRDNNPNFNIL